MTPTRRRQRHRTTLVAVLVAGGLAGMGLFVGGALAAREAADTIPDGRAARPDAFPVTTASPTSTTLAPTPTSSTTEAPTTTTTTPGPVPGDGSLEPSEAGAEVAALQARLVELGYWLGTPDATYGQLTRQAVMAFQKAEGLSRDGVAGAATLAALQTAVRPAPHDPTGSHIEIDLDRQILLVVQDGQTRWVINTSTGSGEAYAAPSGGTAVAATPRGSFTVEREIDGLRQAPLGTLYRPKYFRGGIAIHGAGQIPAHPASHGCARVTNAAMDMLWATGVTALGTTVLVY